MFNTNYPKTKRGEKLLLIAASIGGILGCILTLGPLIAWRNTPPNPNGEYATLRGETTFRVDLTVDTSAQAIESITIVSRTASRVIVDKEKQMMVYGNPVSIDPSLWKSLEDLRYRWCEQPPSTHYPQNEQPIYKVIVACHPLRSPVFYFPPEQLDVALQTIIEITRKAPLDFTESLHR